MATGQEQQFAHSDSDSDDEFFDALASEDKAVENEQGKQTGSREDGAPFVKEVCTESPDVDKNGSGDVTRTGELSSGNTLETVDKIAEEIVSRPDIVSNGTGDNSGNIHSGVDIQRSTTENPVMGDSAFKPASTAERLSKCEDGGEVTETTQSMTQSTCTSDSAINEGLKAEEEEEETKKGDEIDSKEAEVTEVDDEQARREAEDALTEEERVQLKDEAQTHKARGNELFKQSEFLDAVSAYSEALHICPLCYQKERSIMFANRAACRVRQEHYEQAIQDCNKALELHPHYLKVWLRRANTYELMEKLDEALADFQKVLELDPGCYEARAACMRLPDQIKERNEKLKAEMFGKLKDLGNLVLRPFGLSTDNFQMQQDPNSGSYSINFRQNQPQPGNGK